MTFGTALVRHISTRTHTRTHNREQRSTHTCLHLLQSHGSLNIRGAAYPLPPCVKPFLQGCVVSHREPVQQHYSPGYTLHLHAISEGRTLSPTPTYGGKPRKAMTRHTHTHTPFNLRASLPLRRYGERCIRTMGTCCVTAEC